MKGRTLLHALWPPIAAFLLVLAAHLTRRHFGPRLAGGVLEDIGQWIDYLIGSLYWLMAALAVIRVLNAIFWPRLAQRVTATPKLLRDFATAMVLMVAVTGIVATVFHQSVVGFWATSSVLGIVLGFALRPLILDFFMGLAINLDRSFQIGDWVSVHSSEGMQGFYGRVTEINWRTSRVLLDDGNLLVVPNSTIGVAGITNFSRPTNVGRLEFALILDYTMPAARARSVMEGALRAIRHPAFPGDPPPQVLVHDTGPFGVTYLLRFWMLHGRIVPTFARATAREAVLEALAKAGVQPARAQQEIWMGPVAERDQRRLAEPTRRQVLSYVDILAGVLAEAEQDQLAAAMAPHRYPAGAAIVRQGEAGQSMFIIAEGAAEVRVAEDGKTETVARLGAGEVFGEMSLLTGAPRAADVVALTQTLAYEIDKQALAALIEARPGMLEPIQDFIAARQRETERSLAAGKGGGPVARTRGLAGRMRRFFGLHAPKG